MSSLSTRISILLASRYFCTARMILTAYFRSGWRRSTHSTTLPKVPSPSLRTIRSERRGEGQLKRSPVLTPAQGRRTAIVNNVAHVDDVVALGVVTRRRLGRRRRCDSRCRPRRLFNGRERSVGLVKGARLGLYDRTTHRAIDGCSARFDGARARLLGLALSARAGRRRRRRQRLLLLVRCATPGRDWLAVRRAVASISSRSGSLRARPPRRRRRVFENDDIADVSRRQLVLLNLIADGR